ncbi:MAG: hypothetical protein ABIN97_12255, partial [Ginsengibacter sp.]
FIMNNKHKSFKPVILFAYVMACIFFIGCSSSKYGVHVKKIKSWGRLEIEFKKDVSVKERNEALKAVEKYYIDRLYEENPELIFSYIRFNINNTQNLPKNNFVVGLNIGLGYSGTNAVGTITPPKCCPKFPKEIPNIENMRAL